MRGILFLMLMLLALPFAATAQETDNTMYTHSQFSLPIPEGWNDDSTETMAHFTQPDSSAQVYALTAEADEVQAGIQAALEQIKGEFALTPVQSNEVPLPGGVMWAQNIYVNAAGGTLIAALGRVQDGITYTIVIEATQADLAAATPALNAMLLGHTVTGETNLLNQLPEYADPDRFTEQDITVQTGDWSLPGTLTIPNGEGPFPAVVLVHGSGPSDRDETTGFNKPFRDLAFGLASQGIAVLRYDKRTNVYPAEMGALETLTIDDETTDDALSAVALLRQTENIDPERIFVLGHSMGGTVAPRIASRDSEIAGIIILGGGARPFDQIFAEQVEYISRVNPDVDVSSLQTLVDAFEAMRAGTDPVEAFGSAAQASYWTSLLGYDAVATAQTLDLPMLVLQGERDYQVTMADYALWQNALGDHENVRFITYPSAQHLFMPLGDLASMGKPQDYNEHGFVLPEVVNDIAGWIKSN